MITFPASCHGTLLIGFSLEWGDINRLGYRDRHVLVVREIDCGNWLARGCMPAHQHCDLFYPPAGDLLCTVRLVQWLGWVFEPQERKKKRGAPGTERRRGPGRGDSQSWMRTPLAQRSRGNPATTTIRQYRFRVKLIVKQSNTTHTRYLNGRLVLRTNTQG